MKVIIAALLFIFLATTPFFSPKAAEVVDKIAALVDDKVITQSDVVAAKNQYSLQELINEKIMESEFEKEKIEVPEDEVDRALQGILTENGTTFEKLQDELIQRGLSLVAYRETIRQDLAKSQFFQKVIYPRIRVSDVDLQDYYKRNTKQYSGFEKIRFLEIMLIPDSFPPGANLQAESLKLAGLLKKGASFSEMARKYSRGAFASHGGDSGLIATKDLRPDLLEILMSLKPNVISDPIPAGNQFFIFKIVETVNPKQRPYMEVKEALRQTYISERMKDELDSFLMEARLRHHIEIR